METSQIKEFPTAPPATIITNSFLDGVTIYAVQNTTANTVNKIENLRKLLIQNLSASSDSLLDAFTIHNR